MINPELARTAILNYKEDSVKLPPVIAVALDDYKKQNPAPIFFAGPISEAAAKAGYPMGAPLTLGSNLKVKPLVSDADQAAIPYPITKTAQVVGLMDALRGPIEEVAKTDPRIDTPLDLVGAVIGPLQLLDTMLKPGPKNTIGVGIAVGQAAVAIGKVAADFIPGLERVRPALVWMAVFLKAGEQIYVVLSKVEPGEVTALKAKMIRSPRSS